VVFKDFGCVPFYIYAFSSNLGSFFIISIWQGKTLAMEVFQTRRKQGGIKEAFKMDE
jgi:hypothetical protein